MRGVEDSVGRLLGRYVVPKATELVFEGGAVSLPPHSLVIVELPLAK